MILLRKYFLYDLHFTVSFYVYCALTSSITRVYGTFLCFQAVSWNFTGYAQESDWETAAHDLYEMAIADGFNLVETSYYTAGYDSPYVFVNRRNEVWWIIADE